VVGQVCWGTVIGAVIEAAIEAVVEAVIGAVIGAIPKEYKLSVGNTFALGTRH